ncbi:MAG: amino acid adenylation domain-containing protein, partial [Candidatus Latescibacterota bacterium]
MDKRIPVSMFEAAADLWPGRTAIDAPDGTLTYAELNHAADSAAGCLVQDDFGAGSIAAVFIPNSAAYIASVIGVQKAGGAFMPVDPKTPYERQARMFALAEPSVVIVDNVHLPVYREFAGRSGFVPRLLMVMSPHGAVRLYPSGGCDSVEPDSVFLKSGKLPAPDDDLYVIFTSGTTGVPKAVLGRQKGLAHFLAWERTEFGLDETVRASNLAPTTFDVSLRDIFVPLTAGGTVVVPEESIKTNPGALLGWVMEKELTLVHIVPSMFRLLLDELEKIPEKERLLPNMQYVMLAGEAVYGRDVLRFRKVMGDGVQLINLYGPSETTLAKLFNRLDFIPENPGKIMPVGRPISNTAVIILKNNRLAEIGEIGEICIKTPFCSKGYLRDPALTATVFVANPITNDPGDIIYRTGDMGRYMSDRSVEFAGRLDRQVKVNGVRVELCEVDEAVNSYPGVKQALVIPHVREDGETSLICYYTETQPVDRGALREHLSRFLYSAMIPSFFVRIEGFPLGINGKINYRALPRPEEIIYQDSDYVAPETVTEKRVAAIWSEILGIEKIGVLTSFNTLGGGSMQAIRCLGRLSREFEIEISLHDFFRTADVRRLAELIESAVESSSLKAIQPQPERPDYPATHSQKRLWMLQKMIPGFTAFNITGCYRVQGELDTEILDRALKKVASRHEILRTVFFEQAGELRQRVKSEPDIHLERLEQAETANDVIRIAEAFFQTVFDIERGPLFRIGVFSGNEGTLLVFVIHHSICDAWSLDLILNETMKLYRGIAANEEETTPPPALQYRDYADWQNTRLTAEGFDAQRRYWLERLKGELPRLDLPLDRPRPARRDYRGATVSYTFPQSLLDKAKAYSAGSGRTLFPILVAGLRALLFRYTGQTEIILNSPVTLRGRSELESMPGDFTNTILLRGTVSDEKPFAAMIDEAVEEVGQAMAHRDYPFDLLAADLNVSRDLSRASISDVGITLVEDLDDAEPPVTGLRFEPVTVDAGISKYDMVFHFNLSSGGLIVAIEYDSVIFRKGRIQRMAANLSALLDHGLTLPGTAVSALDVVDAAERSLIESFQFPRPRGYTDLTIHGEFERVARKHSDDCALVMRDGSCISYADLDYEANTVADMLLAHGYGGGERIAVHMHRGTDVPIAILGILKAGCVYVPVAADCPPTRISHILDDCGAVAAIVSGGLEKNLPGGITCLDIADAKRFPGKPHAVDVKPDDAAYIIYTSGSTGRPKGVLLQHLGIVNRARDLNERIAITSKDRFTQFASLSFDASLYEIFCALLNGASLMVVERDIINNTDAFINLLGNMKVTFTLLPPAYLRQLRRRKLPGIRVLKTAGEAADVNDALHYAREAVYLNGYGPTEDSICSTVFTVDPKGDYPLGIPIGGPVGDTEALVLDSSLRAVPVGVPGQLCVSDRGLAHGYVNLPEQTAKAFVPHPGDSAKRIYLTGDCVRWNEDGSLLFMGRIDNQVKIAGHRIEPGEIESVMRGIDGIADVCVTTVGEAGDLRLAAYYTGSAGAGGL